jgi:hypothetical protein
MEKRILGRTGLEVEHLIRDRGNMDEVFEGGV